MSVNESIKLNHVGISTVTEMAVALLAHAINSATIPQNMFIHGPPGCGKSAVVAQLPKALAKVLNRPESDFVVIDIRLSAMEAADVLGIPYVSMSGERVSSKVLGDLLEQEANGETVSFEEMRFSTPSWFPKDDGKIYIVFFDELSNCSVSVQQAAYRLILDRQAQNGTKFPDTTFIIAAGNRKEDKTGAKPILPALANRFAVHLYVTKFDDTITHFIKSKFDEEIIAFLESDKSAIYNTGESDNRVRTEDAYATPRTWEEVNKLKNNPMIDDRLFNIAITGCIGAEMASRFLAFRQFRQFVPDYKRIRAGDPTYTFSVDSLETSAQFAIGITIGLQLRETLIEGLSEETDRLVEILKLLPPEILVVMFRSMVRDSDMPLKILQHPSLREQFQRYSAVLNQKKQAA